ncbi:MAG: single-stranded DNA-binding protein [Candidatus Peribacteraceae bacterium]|nr:single-stranded DNA-binding protein [Candidatus Peribacteraceae bacterium]
MRSINKVMLIGHLAGDPEVRETKSGKKVARFSVATNYESSGDKKKQYVDFHRVAAWSKLAEVSAKWLKKGMGVYIEGHLRNDSYEKDGQKRTMTEIVLDNLNILKWGKNEVGVEEVTA